MLARMVDDRDYLILARETFSTVVELQAQIGALQLVIQQKTSITLEDIRAARMELERRKPSIRQLQEQIQGLGREDLFEALRNYTKDFGPQ
jgi:hypothetical protein